MAPNARTAAVRSIPAPAPRPGGPASIVPLLEWKFVPPPTQARTVLRRSLLARLRASKQTPLVCVVAPAGFGKTTVAAQWSARDRRPFLWVSIDERDDDPAVLAWCLATALRPVCRVEPAEAASGGLPIRPTAGDLAAALRRATGPFVLVLDN